MQRQHLSHKTNNQWWKTSLPLRIRFYCCNPIGSGISFQQCHFNSWFHIYLWRYQGIFSMLTYGMLQIYQNTFPLDSRRNTHPIQFVLSCWTWRLRNCKVRRGMYGLKQDARLVFDNIVKLLEPHSYLPVWGSTGLWKHQNRATVFTLCVNDFGMKANSMEDAHQLINVIRKYLEC